MTEPWWDEFRDTILEGTKQLAKDTVSDYSDVAQGYARKFIDDFKADLEIWTNQLIDGKITKEDYKDLIESQEALAEIHSLTQIGIAKTKAERFRKGFLKLISNTAIDMI